MSKRLVLLAVVAFLGIAAIAARLLLPTAETSAVARIDGYATTSDPRQIVLRIDMGSQAEVLGQSIVEDSEKVVISVRITNPGVFDEGRFVLVPITLKAPLGSRHLIDGATGSEVPGG